MRLRYAAALLIVISPLSSAAVLAEPAAPPPYRDAKLGVDARVADLLGRMTPVEKVAQQRPIRHGCIHLRPTSSPAPAAGCTRRE